MIENKSVEIIPKKAPTVSVWWNILFYFLLLLVIALIAGFFVLENMAKDLTKELNNIKAEVEAEKTAERLVLQKDLLDTKRKVGVFSQLINQHQKSSAALYLAQDICHPRTWFTSFSFALKDNQVSLTGVTENFLTMGQQQIFLEREENAKNTELSSIALGTEGRVNFNTSFSLEPKILSFLSSFLEKEP